MKSHQKRLKARRHNKEADDDSMVFASWKEMLFSSSRTFRRLAKKRVGSVRAPQNFPHPVGLIREINSRIKCNGLEDKKAS